MDAFCDNELTVQGPAPAVEHFLDLIHEDIITGSLRLLKSLLPPTRSSTDDKYAPFEQWGTFSGDIDTTLIEDEGTLLVFEFMSEGVPLTHAFDTIAMRFTKLDFTLRFWVAERRYKGQVRWQNGQSIERTYIRDWDASDGDYEIKPRLEENTNKFNNIPNPLPF